MAIGARNHGAVLLILLVTLFPYFQQSASQLQRIQQAAKPDGSLSLLAIGDWGRRGAYNQSEVAVQMGRIGKELDIDFVISVGDNFYNSGLTGVEDTAFEESFTNVYTAKSLQKPWYTVLGNHDYRGDALAQFSPVLKKLDSKWICIRSFVVNAEVAEFFLLDTTPLVEHYWSTPKDHTYDWREISSRDTYMKKLLKDLDSALKESTAKWKIVVGHHTIRSVGKHGDTEDLVQNMLPVLEANNVDLYINGHDHCLQHISSIKSPIQFFTSGGGSKAWRGLGDKASRDGLQFYYDGQGFLSLQLKQNDARIVFYDINGNSLHQWTLSKQFFSSM